MITLVMLGVAENEVIESLNIDTTVIPRWELRVLFLISSFLIICGILESLLVTFSGILLSFESIPYITVLLSGRLRR
ncbi:hypothetical protein [Acidianus sp. RZ1]|nr:hypothetical protein [Acidianus sp. RZ1]